MTFVAHQSGHAPPIDENDALPTHQPALQYAQTAAAHEVPQTAASGSSFVPQPVPIAPAPVPAPAYSLPALQYNGSLNPIDTSLPGNPTISTSRASPLSAELRLQTDIAAQKEHGVEPHIGAQKYPSPDSAYRSQIASAASGPIPVRTSSIKSLTASHFTGGSLSPASVASSPGVGPLSDITPLPSPLGSTSVSWVNMPAMPAISAIPAMPAMLATSPLSPPTSASPSSPPRKRKIYNGLAAANAVVHSHPHSYAAESSQSRNRRHSDRSVSEYVPANVGPRIRNAVVSGSQASPPREAFSKPMQREEYLATQRGLSSVPTVTPPTPPSSNRGATDSSEGGSAPSSPQAKPMVYDRYEARMLKTNKQQEWIAIRKLGTGTFSTVMLATSDPSGAGKSEDKLDPKSLVAVKICEHGPAGGADEKKIESSLKRELEILKCINHTSLVRLRAINVIEKRAFIVLDYSAGGDLFELASLKLHLLVPAFVRRMFSELIGAVTYLHGQYIVHRDIKLENILVNPRLSALSEISNYQTHPVPLITLTDLGLGRFIPRPPASPLLKTRCGSEDYAAPELLMGQEYDGRQTDAWALGVTLYALLEGRLPFDPTTGRKKQSPVSHRIARCEWGWSKWGDANGEWDSSKEGAKEREGARLVVEGLLKRARSRWSLEKVAEEEWVNGGIAVEGGLERAGFED